MSTHLLLLVEDNRDDEDLALAAFRKTKIELQIDVVRDGAEALDYVFAIGSYTNRNADKLPDVILLDLNLPKISGIDVLKKIRANEKTKLIPIVILSSSSEQRDLKACYGGGANSYVVKPVNFVQFNDTVQNLCSYWLCLNLGFNSFNQQAPAINSTHKSLPPQNTPRPSTVRSE